MVAGQHNQYGNYMQFEVLLAVIITAFWDVALSRQADILEKPALSSANKSKISKKNGVVRERDNQDSGCEQTNV